MATPNVGILTTAGKALIDKVNSGQAKISFSKVVFSSMDNSQLSDTQIKDLTAIAPQEVVVSSPQTTLDTNSGETRIRATGTNEKLADGVYVKTYGVFAKDDTGNEILYGVTVSPNPNYFPAYDGVTPQAVTYSYKTVIQETSNITMTNSNDVYVSQEDLTEAIAKIPQPDLSGYDKTDDVDKKLQNKQDKLGFTAADDSKVVHTADMRKPANQVASIDEVNAKQDKIGYTPANDSKVVHDNRDNTITANGTSYDLSKAGLTPLQSVSSGSFNDLPLGTVFADATKMADGPDSINSFTTKTFYSSQWKGRKAQIAIADSTNLMSFRTFNGNTSVWSSWDKLADDSTVVHTADMRKPANDVAGIEEVNAKQDKLTITPADDSKVAHLSGANNFDTVPTVNNNPLLLASSLPSDLARTGQKTNFTAGLQSGGVDVATAADLKSVKDSAWRELDLSGTSGIYTGKILIKIDQVNKYVYFMMNAQIPRNNCSVGTKIIDLSNVVTGLSSAHGYFQGWLNNRENPYNLYGSTIKVSGACLTLGVSYSGSGASRIATEADPNKQYCYAVYDDLVNN